MNVPTTTRFAPGVCGISVVVRQRFRRVQFLINPEANGAPRHATAALLEAIESAFDCGGAAAVVEEATILLKSGAVPLPGSGRSVSHLPAMLQPFAGFEPSLAEPRPKSAPAA